VKELSSWSARRVIVACVLWLLGAPVLVIGLALGGLVLAALSGRQTIGFSVFSVSLSNWSWAWLYLPPIALIAAWIWSRRRAD